MVLVERQYGRRSLPALPEDGDVGVAEPVDRLELVAHDEEVARRVGAAGQKVEELGLESIRVLELVHHDRSEALALALADLGVVPQQPPRVELQILEVERRLAALRLGVRPREGREELLKEIAIPGGQALEGRCENAVQRLVEGRCARAARLHVRECQQALGEHRATCELEGRASGIALEIGGTIVLDEARGGFPEVGDTFVELRSGAGLEHEIAAGRAERRVDLDEHSPQAVRAVRREELPAVRLVGRTEALQRRRERLGLEDEGLRLVEDTEARVDTGREWVCAQEPAAEAVDRRDPGTVERQREIGSVALEEPGADPRSQLSRGALGVRDHEQRIDVEAVVDDRPDEPLHEHGGLSGAGSGSHEDGAAGIDRRPLLGARGGSHGRSFRHIRQRSHQGGQVPPWGSCLTSPSRIRSTSATAPARASLTASSNASGSR